MNAENELIGCCFGGYGLRLPLTLIRDLYEPKPSHETKMYAAKVTPKKK
jgi:hypothetical protein